MIIVAVEPSLLSFITDTRLAVNKQPSGVCYLAGGVTSCPDAAHFLSAGEVHEAGAGRDRAAVGLHRQTGHQHVWEVSGRQHRGLRGGVLAAVLGSSQHPGALCGTTPPHCSLARRRKCTGTRSIHKRSKGPSRSISL